MDPSNSAALKAEIARLTGVIEQRKNAEAGARSSVRSADRSRSNVYVNPNYKPPSRAVPASRPIPRPPVPLPAGPASTKPRDVVIGGVAFQSSGRSLVRKDLAKTLPASIKPSASIRHTPYPKPVVRAYKPKAKRGRNLTLNNIRGTFQSRRSSAKRKYVDKPCPRFTTTGTCTRGLTCPYRHDPSKVAICWNFLQGNCPNTAETCNLSHDPTPERTPLCVHFANAGRCTRQNCPFPHVRVGPRHGVCRDFAVLGYCEKGLDCDKQHVRECPDFAENGVCTTKGCKLPHVIRASRTRKVIAAPPSILSSGAVTPGASTAPSAAASDVDSGATTGTDGVSGSRQVYAEDAQLGDEYISLTFHESEGSSEEESEEEDEEEDEDDAGMSGGDQNT